MRPRTALLLALAALAMLALAVVPGATPGGPLGGPLGGTADPAAGPPLFAGFAAALPQAARVEVVRAGRTLAMARGADGVWGLPEHAFYPVDPALLHGLLAGLAGLHLAERRTDDPDAFGRLGLDDPAHEDAPGGAGGTLVRVLRGDGGVLGAVILGHPDQGGGVQDTFLRRPGERQTWLASAALAVPADWRDWVADPVLDVPAEAVAAIHSEREGAPPLDLARDGDHLVPVEGGVALDRYKLDDMARALSGLRLLDVAPAPQAPGRMVGRATVTTRDGTAIAAQVRRDGAAVWLVLTAAGDSAAARDIGARLAPWALRVDPGREAALVPTVQDVAAYAATAAAAARAGRR